MQRFTRFNQNEIKQKIQAIERHNYPTVNRSKSIKQDIRNRKEKHKETQVIENQTYTSIYAITHTRQLLTHCMHPMTNHTLNDMGSSFNIAITVLHTVLRDSC
jgi:hypothetical protein